MIAFRCFSICPNPIDLLQFGGGGHAGERIERLGDHHYLPPQQQTADCGGPFYQADGQRV